MTLLEPIVPALALPQRVLLVENSRTYVRAVAQAIEHKLELPVMVASTLAEARADIGSLAFAAVVIVTLLAARSFDPRLIWQHDRQQAAAVPDPAQPRGA